VFIGLFCVLRGSLLQSDLAIEGAYESLLHHVMLCCMLIGSRSCVRVLSSLFCVNWSRSCLNRVSFVCSSVFFVLIGLFRVFVRSLSCVNKSLLCLSGRSMRFRHASLHTFLDGFISIPEIVFSYCNPSL